MPMKVPLRWLAEFVDTGLSPDELAHRLTMAGLEAEKITGYRRRVGQDLRRHVEAVERHPDADRLVLATVDAGRAPAAGRHRRAEHRPGPEGRPGAGRRATDRRSRRRAGLPHPEAERDPRRSLGGDGLLRERAGTLRRARGHHGPRSRSAKGRAAGGVAGRHGDRVRDHAEPGPRLLDPRHRPRSRGAHRSPGYAAPDLRSRQRAIRAGRPRDGRRSGSLRSLRRRRHRRASRSDPRRPGCNGASSRPGCARSTSSSTSPTTSCSSTASRCMPSTPTSLADDRIVVRRARPGETTGNPRPSGARSSTQEMLVIADADRAVGLAGVMGGVDSEVTDDTRRIVLESANFDMKSVRRTARELKLRTDASARFERGLDPNLARDAAARATRTHPRSLPRCDGRHGRGRRLPAAARRRARSSLPFAEIERLLGVRYEPAQVLDVLSRLGFSPAARRRRRRGDAAPDRPHLARRRHASRPTSSRRWPASSATKPCPSGSSPEQTAPVRRDPIYAMQRDVRSVLDGRRRLGDGHLRRHQRGRPASARPRQASSRSGLIRSICLR